MSDADCARLVDYLAYNPAAGDLFQGISVVHKLRWALEGRGKSGGARVIYFNQKYRFAAFYSYSLCQE
jgi:hypothetical protein